MFDLAPLAIGTTVRSGPSQWLAEAVATFTLVLAILGWAALCAVRDPMACRTDDYRGLLVHRIDVLRQPGGYARARFYDDLCRHGDQFTSPLSSWRRLCEHDV
jgi:hypothetical protein